MTRRVLKHFFVREIMSDIRTDRILIDDESIEEWQGIMYACLVPNSCHKGP